MSARLRLEDVSVQFAGLTPLNAPARVDHTVRGRVFGGNLTVEPENPGSRFVLALPRLP